MQVSAIIVAGGRGERLGGVVPKQLRLIGGRTILERSLAPFDAVDSVQEIIVVLPLELMSPPPKCLSIFRKAVHVVPGGACRQDSVAAGFDVVASGSDLIVIHDAARPFCTRELVERTLVAATEAGAAIAAVAVQDTLKEGRVESGVEIVARTLSREKMFLAQTPQAFTRQILEEAITLGRSGVVATDEAALAEHAGHRVRLVEGDLRNVKITTEVDLTVGQEMMALNETASPHVRVGLGYDLHRLVKGRPLVLGGITIPGKRGLLGHSDADVVCHAVADAVLGAANAGDIGIHFPDDDKQWKDVSSIDLLEKVTALVFNLGFVVDNVDVVVITEWPKIRDHADAMRQQLASALRVGPDRVAIKGKTNEGVGPVGRGEAIIVHAIALVRHRALVM